MTNSTIVRKKCKCGCNKYPTMSCFGFNYNCLPDDLKEKAGTRKKVQQKIKNKRVSMAAKMRQLQRELSGDKELDLWFLFQMHRNEKVCENCGVSLKHYREWEWRGSQHHIIDKSPINGCPSVATNPYNHGVLGYWCCHSQWHTSYLNAEKMPFFKIAKERFELFKDKIIESERKKIPECFL